METSQPLAVDDRAVVRERMAEFDRDWSRFRHDSIVEAIRTTSGPHLMPPDADPLMNLYGHLYRATDGAMSPTVGNCLEHLGYDAGYRLQALPGCRPAAPWGRTRWEPPFLHTEEPFVLDIGAAGKGYLVDIVSQLIATRAGCQVTVDASGDMVHRSDRPLRVALEHPECPGQALGVAILEEGPGRRALCASATNRRSWGEGLHHVVDARTGAPVSRTLATWVQADTALVADGLATALFFLEDDRAEELAHDLGASFIRFDQGSTSTSRRLVVSCCWTGESFE